MKIHKFNKLELWLLKKLARFIVKHAGCRKENLISYFRIILDEANQHMIEDSYPHLDAFVAGCYKEACDQSYFNSWRS